MKNSNGENHCFDAPKIYDTVVMFLKPKLYICSNANLQVLRHTDDQV